MSPAEVRGFLGALAAANPEPRSELHYTDPFTLLVAVALSAQTTDVAVTGLTGGAESWRVVLLRGDDGKPFTRTLLLGLGEELTNRGLVAILDPRPLTPGAEDEPLPLGADVVLHLRAEGVRPDQPGGSLTATAVIAVEPVRLPADHPATRFLPTLPPLSAGTLTVVQTSSGGHDVWPAWYAAVGHGLANSICARLAVPAKVADGEAAAHITSNTWLTTAALTHTAGSGLVAPDQAEAVTADGTAPPIYGRIPSPPQSDVAVDLRAFQYPLVRGWMGRINQVPVDDHKGGTRPALDELRKRLGKGAWQTQPTPAGYLALYSKEENGLTRLLSLRVAGPASAAAKDEVDLVEWQERPSPGRVYQEWASLAPGNVTAAALLSAHAETPAIPLDLRHP